MVDTPPDLPAAPSPRTDALPSDQRIDRQGRIILHRMLSNRGAMVCLVTFIAVYFLALTSVGFAGVPGWWQHDYISLHPPSESGAATLSLAPTWLGGEGIRSGQHPFGQNRIGIDYFAMVMRGVQNSVLVMVIIGGASTCLGTVVGAVAGYYLGWVDAVLMRITDAFIVIPALVIGAVVGRSAGGLGIWLLALLLAFVSWMGIARLVRAEFLTLREREFVSAARIAGASDLRIIFRHILPNAVGVVIVSATLLAAAAVLLETALSYLGYGIQAPEISLGRLISENQSAFSTRPWLYWWPALFIVGLALLVNFVGDGLRDAFDPRHKRVRWKRMRESTEVS